MTLLVKAGLFTACLAPGWALAAPPDGAPSILDLKIDPPLERLRPNRDEARLALRQQEKPGAGKQIRWNIALDLPPQGRFFSTDFPWIEGKRLFEAHFATAGEEVAWSLVFPIRGRYELTVRRQTEGSAPVESRFSLAIREDPRRLWYLGLSLTGLFFLGMIIGRVTPAPRTTAVLALLLLGGVAAEAGLRVETARVGDPTPIRFVHADPEEAGVALSIVREEDGKRLFHIGGVLVPRSAVWSYHFFDGSPHRVTARVGGAQGAAVTEREVHVDGREPPGAAIGTAYLFFLLPLAAGYLASRWMIAKKL